MQSPTLATWLKQWKDMGMYANDLKREKANLRASSKPWEIIESRLGGNCHQGRCSVH